MSLPKVIIHCQYVYGLGHLIRALQLANGLTKNFEVYFLSGGESVLGISINPNVKFVQLEAIYKNEQNEELVSVDDDLSIEKCFELRNKKIQLLVNQVKPDVVITEHFPFGFLFEQEVMSLISYAKLVNSQAKIVCSVRDVIENSEGSESDAKTVNLLNQYYDLLLIHGDENLIPIESSFPLIKKIVIEKYLTGYIVDGNLQRNEKHHKSILVSIAGGRIGSELLIAVQEAFELLTNEIPHDLIVFEGAFDTSVGYLVEDPRIKRFNFNRSKFLELLSQAELTISLGGYNTTVESVFAGKKALVYNRIFYGKNREQDIRISTFANLGLIQELKHEDLKKEKLAEIIKKMIVKPKEKPNLPNVNFNGVTRSVLEINKLIHA